MVNGGTEGAAGDTFVINGNASSEAFRIYTPRLECLAANAGAALNAATEIVVTRNGTDRTPRHRRTERDRRNPHQRRRPFGCYWRSGSWRYLRGHRRLLRHQPASQHHHDRWRRRRRHGRHLVARVGPPHRLQVQRRQRHHHRDLAAPGCDRTARWRDAADYTTTTDANGVSTMTNGTHSVTFTAPTACRRSATMTRRMKTTTTPARRR